MTSSSGQATGESANAATPPRRHWRKLWKRIAFGFLGLLAILLVVFFLLPVWISNEQGRTYVLERINRHLHAKISIEDWSLGWFRGTELKNVTITLPDGSRMLWCPRVESDLTLWGFLWGHYDVGNTRIETAQVQLTRFADGTTSLDALLPESGATGASAAGGGVIKMLRTLRGSLQVGSAVVTVNSVSTGESVTYSDVKASVTIASSDAPFHVQIFAVGAAGAAGQQNLSYNATLPPLSAWPASPWTLLADTEFSAMNVPTRLACDWAGLDPRWSDSLGQTLERVRFSAHDTPPLETSRLTLEIKGTKGAYVDGPFVLRKAVGNGVPAMLSLPADSDRRATAALFVSAPLTHVLRRVNPAFAALESGDGMIGFTLTELNLSADDPNACQAAGRITFPQTMLLDRAGVLGELLKFGRGLTIEPANPVDAITVTADPLRLRISNGFISYDNFTIDCGRHQRVTFGGAVGLNGTLNLMATVPATGSGTQTLGVSTANVPLSGTIDKPLLRLPG